jgi:hypothetical protein
MRDFVIKHVQIADGLSPKEAPSLSLHVLAKNADVVLGRLCDHVGPYVREARFVLNDTTDKSREVITAHMEAFSDVSLDIMDATSVTHPEFYFEDTKASYELGRPLSTEVFEGPFTEKPLLADWAGVRNLGWDSNTEWKMFLDADDMIDDIHKLPGVIQTLHNAGADLAASRYTFGRSPDGRSNSMAYRERLALNADAIKWYGKTHESLLGGERHVLLEDCLFVTDLRDNWGEGVRVPGRCFKVLYHEARRLDWKVPPRHLAYLVQESPGLLPLLWVTRDLLPAYLQIAMAEEEIAWVHSMVGEGWERAGNLGAAGVHYMNALTSYPTSKTAWRLCRVFFLRREWRDCISAYEQGVASAATPQILDMGAVYEHSTKILVAQAYHELGNRVLAKKFIDEACLAFPDARAVAILKEGIYAG